jgi:carbon storage regulator CsrA
MLLLSRKRQELIVIGGGGGLKSEVRVRVLEIREGSVKLGFEADPGVPIHRGEIWVRIRAADALNSPQGVPSGAAPDESIPLLTSN